MSQYTEVLENSLQNEYETNRENVKILLELASTLNSSNRELVSAKLLEAAATVMDRQASNIYANMQRPAPESILRSSIKPR